MQLAEDGGARVRSSLVSREQESAHLAPHRSAGESSDGAAGRITVVLGRFDALVGHGLAQILREDRSLRIVGADLDRAALEGAVARWAPRVVVLDEASVVEPSVLERVRAAQPTLGIVVLAQHPTVAYAMRLLGRGASCLSKGVSATDILIAVHVAADGRRVFADVGGHLVERSCPEAASALTPREAEVLEYLSRGCSHAEIAHALRLGVETVRTHSAHIRSKLGVRSKRELIGLAIPVRSETEPQRRERG
jgi:DNA-binding NarL/FixJ family response regulator